MKFFVTLPRHFRHSVRHHLHPFFPNFFSKHLQMSQHLWQRFKKSLTILNCSPTNWTKRAVYIFFKRSIKIKYKDWIGHIPNFDRNMTKKPSMIFLFLKGKKFGELFWDHSPKHKCSRTNFTVLLLIKKTVIVTINSQKLYIFWTIIH